MLVEDEPMTPRETGRLTRGSDLGVDRRDASTCHCNRLVPGFKLPTAA
jgi:hypothetical protein